MSSAACICSLAACSSSQNAWAAAFRCSGVMRFQRREGVRGVVVGDVITWYSSHMGNPFRRGGVMILFALAATWSLAAQQPGTHPLSGRVYAGVMSYQGADWLDRPER